MVRTYQIVGVDNKDVPPLVVRASCERVAVARLCKMLVQHHCREKGLPYYTCGCTMIGDAGPHNLAWDLGSIADANWRTALEVAPDPRRRRYQAFRYIAGGRRDAHGKRVCWGDVPDPEARPDQRGWGHVVTCGGLWMLEEV